VRALVVVAVVVSVACAPGCGSSAEPEVALSTCERIDHSGEGTYYAADGSGNCSFDPSPGDLRVAAMNTPDYAGSAMCGACVEVTGPKGTITVRIVDRCPECPAGDVDLSESAFAEIAEVSAGRVPITWHLVPCAVDGPMSYRFKEGSSQYWTAIQVRDHRHPIARLEVKEGDAWRTLGRESYNYFVGEGLGPGPYTLRITDAIGHVVEEPAVELGDAVVRQGSQQLPACD
jgi:expansin